MTNDALEPWIRAYRDENPGEALDARGIRRRVLVRAGMRQRRRLFTLRFLVPVAATFFGSVALAASHGSLPHFDEVRAWLGVAPAETPLPPAPPRPRATGPRRAPSPPPHAGAVPAPAPSAEPTPGLSLDELPAESARDVRAPSTPKDPLKGDLAAYEAAHRLHFHGGDSAGALVAWDRYLASHPSGTFAPEARFNRAVCLLRLGRRSEARAVLVSIAENRTGAYGRERAQAFLDAME